MTEKMNPPVLELKTIQLLESLKQDLGIRLKSREDGSSVWNEYIFSYAIEFYRLFHEYYSTFPDFADRASDAARDNAVANTTEVIRRQMYNFNSLQPAYQKKIFERISEYIRREQAKHKTLTPAPIIPVPNHLGLSPLALGIPPLKPINDVLNRRRAVVQPLLDGKFWTIYDWAQAARVSHHTASDYLNGKRKTQPYNLKKLADAIGLTYQQLPK